MEVNNTWPGWENVSLLGEGSFGRVYEIQRREFGTVYEAALKVITIPPNRAELDAAYDDGMDDESVTGYFKGVVTDIISEVALMSELKGHSNIVSYEDHMVLEHKDSIGWDILIRMEKLTPLQTYCKSNALSEQDVLKLGVDISNALELCQKRRVLHRDIKPENIFVSRFGDYKLGDFGIARTVEKTVSNLSKKGTYSYMAPEVYRGEPYGLTADIYSLAMVLYRYLNENRLPFMPLGVIRYTDREQALERRISGEAVPAPVSGSTQLKQVICKALAYDPGQRYQTPTEFRKALEACREQMGNTADRAAALNWNTDSAVPDDERTTDIYGAGYSSGDSNTSQENSTETKETEENEQTIGLFGAGDAKTDPPKDSGKQPNPPIEPEKPGEQPLEPLKTSAEEKKEPEAPKQTSDGQNSTFVKAEQPKKRRKGVLIAIAAVIAFSILIVFLSKLSAPKEEEKTLTDSLQDQIDDWKENEGASLIAPSDGAQQPAPMSLEDFWVYDGEFGFEMIEASGMYYYFDESNFESKESVVETYRGIVLGDSRESVVDVYGEGQQVYRLEDLDSYEWISGNLPEVAGQLATCLVYTYSGVDQYGLDGTRDIEFYLDRQDQVSLINFMWQPDFDSWQYEADGKLTRADLVMDDFDGHSAIDEYKIMRLLCEYNNQRWRYVHYKDSYLSSAKTARGIKIGSTENDVMDAYGFGDLMAAYGGQSMPLGDLRESVVDDDNLLYLFESHGCDSIMPYYYEGEYGTGYICFGLSSGFVVCFVYIYVA